MRGKPNDLTFEILWLNDDVSEIGVELIHRHDLDEAIRYATNRFGRPRGNREALAARGFVVRRYHGDNGKEEA
jgi:hypothetical protein